MEEKKEIVEETKVSEAAEVVDPAEAAEENAEKKKEPKDNRIKIHIRSKINIMLIVFALILAGGTILVGRDGYKDAITDRYDELSYQLAATVAGYFSEEEIKTYADVINRYTHGEATDEEVAKITSSDRYKEIKSLVENAATEFGTNDIYVCVIDEKIMDSYTPELKAAKKWKPIGYIMDNFHDKSEELSFGDRSSMYAPFKDAVYKSLQTGERPDMKFISDTQYGYNIQAVYPVVVDGKTIASIGVEIPMKTLNTDVRNFSLRIGGLSLIVLIFALLIFSLISRKMLVRPINLVANEANHFISKEAVVSDKLSTIKSRDELQMLAENILAMELSIKDYIENIREITAEKERIGAELNIATQIQASMLPTDFDNYAVLKEFDLYATMDPAKEVGGDFYDFFMISSDTIALVMADVSGKGVPAALFMAKAKTSIKTRAMQGGSPSEILSDVNDQMCEGNEAELFVTVWLAIINIRTGKGMAANAGHEHPALRHKDGSFELIKYRHSPAVATMEGLPFKEHEFELVPGDTLYVYTDGVTEATDANNELFGEERLETALNHEPDALPDKLLRIVREDIDEFVGKAPQFDDVTMLAFKYYGPNGGE